MDERMQALMKWIQQHFQGAPNVDQNYGKDRIVGQSPSLYGRTREGVTGQALSDNALQDEQQGPSGQAAQGRSRAAGYRSITSNGELDPNYGANFRTMIQSAGPNAALAYLLAQQRDFGGDPTAVSRQLGNNDRLQRDLAEQLHPSFDWMNPRRRM